MSQNRDFHLVKILVLVIIKLVESIAYLSRFLYRDGSIVGKGMLMMLHVGGLRGLLEEAQVLLAQHLQFPGHAHVSFSRGLVFRELRLFHFLRMNVFQWICIL